MRSAVEGASSSIAWRGRASVFAVAGLLFAGVFALRLAIEDPDSPISLLYVLPIALLAVERGARWGLVAAALALGLFTVWDLASSPQHDHVVDYLTRGAVFFVVGGFVGALADGLRHVSAESDRFWELSTDLLGIAGFDGYFKRVNPAWERILGWTAQEFCAQPFVEFVHPDDRERTAAEAAGLTRVGYETLVFENRYRCKDGGYRTILWGASSTPEEELIYATGTDITDRKLAESAAAAANAEARRANLAKSEFLSRMSHELRTPLNAVIGFGQLLELDDMDPGQAEAVEQIVKGGRHLLELINEVLDISQIETGTMSISLEPVHLGSVLAEALSLIRPLADQAHVRLVGTPAEEVDLYVRADQQRLKQVLINLLSNAVKYNRRGGEVAVRCARVTEGRIELAVADTGNGMTAEQLTRIFEPFDRLGAERTDIQGTGLGLSLSRALMHAMGGTITAESQPEIGSTMHVELDAAEGPGMEATVDDGAPAAANGAFRDRTVVYIEDNLSNLKLVERVLARLPGVRLVPAMQAELGMDLVRQHQPDMVLLDLHLPDLYGGEVLAQLKRDPETAAIPVVILSADATPTQLDRLLSAGAAGYLTKPIDVRSLLDIVRISEQAHPRDPDRTQHD